MGGLSSRHLALLAATAALCAALVAGCGGDDTAATTARGADAESYEVVADTTITTASIPEASLTPRINKICRKAWVIILDNFTVYSSTHDPEMSTAARFEDAARLSLLAGLDFHIFDNIYNLGAPRGEEREVEKIIGRMQLAVELGQKKLSPVESVPQIADLFSEYNESARRYGLAKDCLVDGAHLNELKLG